MSAATATTEQRDWAALRDDFPILSTEVGGKPLAYLDNAASGQMPQRVIDRIVRYQSHEHANIHRGVHHLSQIATDAFEEARGRVARFIGASTPKECIFTSGTTEGINLVMNGWGRKFVSEGDVIVLSTLEHHSNIVPWQMLREQTGAEIRVIPMLDDGTLDFEEYLKILDDGRVKLVGLVHVSNALGTVNDVRRYADAAHDAGAVILADGAQAVPHLKVKVEQLGVDFYAFSGHKMYGPTGTGVLWGRSELLEEMDPFMGGGDMILDVSFEKTTYNTIPHKFEAGTPPIMGVVGLGEAVAYLEEIGLGHIHERETELLAYAEKQIRAMEGIEILGPADGRAAVLSMVVEAVHPHDVGTILDQEGVAIRAGHHCAQPLMKRLGVPATARASLAFYNDFADVDALVSALGTVREIFD